MATEKRQRQKEGHRLQREEMQRQARRRQTRRRLLLFGGALVVFFGGLYVVSLLQDDDSGDEAADTTTTVPATTTTAVPIEPTCPPVDGSAERATAFTAAPELCIDPAKTYTATIDTTEGPITLDLDTTTTPNTVNNFVFLSRYKYYDGTPVFRTDPSLGIIQAGGASNTASPGYTIQDEGNADFTYEPGQIVMARGGEPNSAGSQFFLVGTDAVETLNDQGTYVVFGTTDQAGIDVINAILALHDPNSTDPLGGPPTTPVTINSVTITES
jgi:cyclophilin family peptidyl-prolyl cis-trans isomerase